MRINLMQISRVVALVVSCRSVKEASIIDVEVIQHNLHCRNSVETVNETGVSTRKIRLHRLSDDGA
jgi:hypothetical protein